jgi:DNA-binding sugar fermentation-stimulating protein
MREDPTVFSTNATTDPSFAQALLDAKQNGVEVLVYKVKPVIENKQFHLLFGKQLPIELQYQM